MNPPLTVPDLLDSASRLGANEFESFFKELLALRAKRIAPVLSEEENNLIEKIYAKLPSNTTAQYALFSEKRRLGTITPPEYETLLSLVPIVEKYNVERLQYIIKLAELRKLTPQILMNQLGLMPLHNG